MPLHLSLSRDDLASYVAHQISAFFPDQEVPADDLLAPLSDALDQVEHCFSRVALHYYGEPPATRFNHLNTDQYAAFLYFLSNTVSRSGRSSELADKLFALNKALHGVDIYHEVALPDVFLLQHPVGTVLGRATYGGFLCVYNNVSVGSNLQRSYPVFGRGVVLFGGARVIGRATVGDNCWIAPQAVVMDRDVPSNSIAYGLPPETGVKPVNRDVVARFFRDEENTH